MDPFSINVRMWRGEPVALQILCSNCDTRYLSYEENLQTGISKDASEDGFDNKATTFYSTLV